jgi:MOSC domain-containing protein YiiM
MGKALDRWMEIGGIRLVEKSAEKAGTCLKDEGESSRQVGSLYSICISPERGQLKREVISGQCNQRLCIENDGHAGPWGRQVTCLNRASVLKAMRNRAGDEGPGDFAENLLIDGIDFKQIQVGSRLNWR